MPIVLPSVEWSSDRPFPSVGYNSYGSWSRIDEIRRIEVEERGNDFPDLSAFPESTPAIWVTLEARHSLWYLVEAEKYDHLFSDEPLTKAEKRMIRYDISKIPIEPSDVVAHYDGDDGYLILRPGGL